MNKDGQQERGENERKREREDSVNTYTVTMAGNRSPVNIQLQGEVGASPRLILVPAVCAMSGAISRCMQCL